MSNTFLGQNFPLFVLDALREVAVHHHGPAHLERGGPVGRTLSELLKGADEDEAVAAASPQGKGFVGELHFSAGQSLHSGLLRLPFDSGPNGRANDPHKDILVMQGRQEVNNAQVGMGKPRYVAQKARTSRAQQVVVNTEARAALRASNDPAYALTQDHLRHLGTRSSSLSAEKAEGESRVILKRLILGEEAVPFGHQLSVSLTSGARAAGVAFARSLLFHAVHRINEGLPFDEEMIRRAWRATKGAFIKTAVTTHLMTTRFLARAGEAFNGRLLRVLGGSVVVAGAIADVVISTANDVVACVNGNITFEELLRRAGVQVFSAGGAVAGAALMLHASKGMPWWASALMVALGTAGGGYAGFKLGEHLLQPNWNLAPEV